MSENWPRKLKILKGLQNVLENNFEEIFESYSNSLHVWSFPFN